MTKVKFIYIGKTMTTLIPKKGFYALKLSKSDKQKLYPSWDEKQIKETTILYPQTHSYMGDDEVFVRGIGWKKFGKTNRIFVPLFSGNIEDWDEYIQTYGKYCLFYSLTGYSLHDSDCCAFNSINEFYSLLQCEGGIEQYQKFVENILEIQKIQTHTISKKLKYLSKWQRERFIQENLIRPCFRVFMLIMPPYLDTPSDDDKLETYYRKYRSHEIEKNHPEYRKMLRIASLMKKERENNTFGYTKKYLEYEKKKNDIHTRIINHVLDTLTEETREGEKNVFPVCMADRMKMLFGEKCHHLYNTILNDFKK